MSREDPKLVVIDDEDGGVVLATNRTPTKDEINPVDAVTGESTFDDLDPRYNMTDSDRQALERARPGGDPEEPDPEDEIEDEDEIEGGDKGEDGPAVVADADEEDEDEVPAKGKPGKWSRRLQRERRLREEIRADLDDTRRELRETRAMITSRQSAEEFATAISELDGKIAGKDKELAEAIENGDSKKQADIISELVDLKAEKKHKKAQHDDSKVADERRTTTASRIVSRRVAQWKRQHERYDKDPVFAAFAKATDVQLGKEGFDPETDEFWTEMDKRLAERYPEEYKGKRAPRERRDPPSLNMGGERGARRPASKTPVGEFVVKNGQVQLTKRHVEIMKTFQMDPSNPEDVKAFVASNR